MKKRVARIFAADFETTVYKGQTYTEVWAAACSELWSDDVVNVFHSIEEQFEYFVSLKCNIVAYYHNLKFDGSFWLSYFLIERGFKQALEADRFVKPSELKNNQFVYSISGVGMWYSITVKVHDKLIEFRDSYKLLPFSLKRIGKSFKTKHQKLEMEYKGFRYAGCTITEDQKRYIANDVLVLKEALEIMYGEGHKRLTIGSCCLAEYEKSIGRGYYHTLYPNMYDIGIDPDIYGVESAGKYISLAYHGGWCYAVKGAEKRILGHGCTADVNSLYPSMMSSESGNRYPVGYPTFWKGDFIPDEALRADKYFFIRVRTRFYLKDGMLPFIQVKHTWMYKPTEMLETSDVLNSKDGKYYREYIDFDGNVVPAVLTLTMTMTDYALFREHYNVEDFEILDGCYFNAALGIFDKYIDKYKQKKLTSKGALRELAKLFLNNLYGKMASSPNSNFKVAYVKEDKSIGFRTIIANEKKPGYIPVGAAITSYARNFTIRAAQKNFYGADEPGFKYADTDSIHCDLPTDQVKGIVIHDKNFCCWKIESEWDTAVFVRQKTYVERNVVEDGEKLEEPHYNIKCAGMPDRCKHLFLLSMQGFQPDENDEGFTEEERDFLKKKRTLSDFNVGLRVPSKLLPKRIMGGVVLMDSCYEMR